MKLNTLTIVHGPARSGKSLIASALSAKNFLHIDLVEGVTEEVVLKKLESYLGVYVGMVITCEDKNDVPRTLIDLANTVYEISTQQTKSRKKEEVTEEEMNKSLEDRFKDHVPHANFSIEYQVLDSNKTSIRVSSVSIIVVETELPEETSEKKAHRYMDNIYTSLVTLPTEFEYAATKRYVLSTIYDIQALGGTSDELEKD